MKYSIVSFTVFLFLFSCNSDFKPRTFTKIEIQPVFEDSTLSVRALDYDEDYLYYGSADHIGKRALKNENKLDLTKLEYKSGKNHFKHIMTYENAPLHFRAIEQVSGHFFAISIANPARLYKLSRKATEPKLVYSEVHENVFYDSMAFWNDREGIAIGDVINGCMSVIITRDGGESWVKLSCDVLPQSQEGEGAFAASDTNIAIDGDKTWVATTAGRILYSEDKGETWVVFETTIMKEKETEGIYSIDFYNSEIGYGIGGDYTKPADSSANKIRTLDGGKTWDLVSENKSPGYRSCVQFIPNRQGMELVAVGFKGVDYSNDGGDTWTHLSDEGFYTIRFINETEAYAAGHGRISKLVFK